MGKIKLFPTPEYHVQQLADPVPRLHDRRLKKRHDKGVQACFVAKKQPKTAFLTRFEFRLCSIMINNDSKCFNMATLWRPCSDPVSPRSSKRLFNFAVSKLGNKLVGTGLETQSEAKGHSMFYDACLVKDQSSLGLAAINQKLAFHRLPPGDPREDCSASRTRLSSHSQEQVPKMRPEP